MAEPYIGQIIAVGFNFAPPGWVACDGRLLPIGEYQVLFALVGTTYGGDGVTTFAVPDLCGRLATSQGQGPGLSNYVLGQTSGAETVTLRTSQLARHGHTLLAGAKPGDRNTPGATVALATNPQDAVAIYVKADPDVSLAPGSIQATSVAGLPHENVQPVQAINYIISTSGLFPQRD